MTTYIIPPTYLYIKKHSVTGLTYFGKTTKNPLKYNGSGDYWVAHIKKHGRKHIITTNVFGPFTNSIAVSEFALAFSRNNNIVESKLWANMEPENGLNGGVPGAPSPKKGKPSGHIPWNKGILNGKKGIPTGPRGKQKNPAPKVECPHCGKIGNRNMTRDHFDNCKMKP